MMNKATYAIKTLSINGVEIPLKGVIDISAEITLNGMVKITLLCDKDCEISAVNNR